MLLVIYLRTLKTACLTIQEWINWLNLTFLVVYSVNSVKSALEIQITSAEPYRSYYRGLICHPGDAQMPTRNEPHPQRISRSMRNVFAPDGWRTPYAANSRYSTFRAEPDTALPPPPQYITPRPTTSCQIGLNGTGLSDWGPHRAPPQMPERVSRVRRHSSPPQAFIGRHHRCR